MKVRFVCFFLPAAVCVLLLACFGGCANNPLTGKSTMALVDNSSLFPESFAAYDDFLRQSTVISSGADAAMVARVGSNIKRAAEIWLESLGYPDYLDNYRWEYKLVKEDAVNAWCMPGGKIVVYTGILPVTQTETGLAVVLGHEISHALLNHGQQNQSASILQTIGAVGVAILMSDQDKKTQETAQTVYSAGTTVLGTLPFSRANESEADHIGLLLMAIAGYDPEGAPVFWQRMSKAGGGGSVEFLSTHPSDERRIKNLQQWIPEAQEKAAELSAKRF